MREWISHYGKLLIAATMATAVLSILLMGICCQGRTGLWNILQIASEKQARQQEAYAENVVQSESGAAYQKVMENMPVITLPEQELRTMTRYEVKDIFTMESGEVQVLSVMRLWEDEKAQKGEAGDEQVKWTNSSITFLKRGIYQVNILGQLETGGQTRQQFILMVD